jgi:hypothetical protein
MGLRHNPVTYLILSNCVLWGLPLAIIQIQSLEADRDAPVTAKARVLQSPLMDDLISLEPLIQPDPLAQLAPLDTNADPAPVALDTTPTSLHVETKPGQALDAIEVPGMPPDLLTRLRGADGLGGPITLASHKDHLVPIAVRAERLQWERSNDALAALPLHWRDSLRQELGTGVRVSQAGTVRLPVRELAERQELPVVINDQGVAEGLVEPRNQLTREAVETWAARQQAAEPGTVQVLLISAEPLPPAQE